MPNINSKKRSHSDITPKSNIYDSDCSDDDNASVPKFPKFIFLFNKTNTGSSPDADEPATPEIIEETCPGVACDHEEFSTNVPSIPGKFLMLSGKKVTIKDLIELGSCYHCKLQRVFREISLLTLAKLRKPLAKLDALIGMKMIKENFAEQIVYFLVDSEPNPAEMLHTILEGPPGVGKSLVIDILAEIYINMGYLTKNVIKKVKISDLKGKYVGHTAPLTQEAIDSAMGGILIIDEAYSLGSEDRLDSFSKEIIDTLNRNLTEKAGKFICMIAGYGDQIEKCLMAHNPGLKSRFRFKFTIDNYSAEELMEIFKLKIEQESWTLDNNASLKNFFKVNYKAFPYYGRDMEILLFHAKMAHSNRIFCACDNSPKKTITLNDVEKGFLEYSKHRKVDDHMMSLSVQNMYS